MHHDFTYLSLCRRILKEGELRTGRNGNTIGLFGEQIKFDLREGFPLLTTKKMFFRGVVEELIWMFILGRTDVKWLQDRKVHIWNSWVNERGTIGTGGYAQLTNWGHETEVENHIEPWNQIKRAAELLKTDPNSRRNFVSAWNPSAQGDCTLPPCHISHQLYCSGEYLDLHMYQRSCDYVLGAPFNIAQYALLLSLYALESGRVPRNLTISFGDVHVYENHIEGAKEQIER